MKCLSSLSLSSDGPYRHEDMRGNHTLYLLLTSEMVHGKVVIAGLKSQDTTLDSYISAIYRQIETGKQSHMASVMNEI